MLDSFISTLNIIPSSCQQALCLATFNTMGNLLRVSCGLFALVYHIQMSINSQNDPNRKIRMAVQGFFSDN